MAVSSKKKQPMSSSSKRTTSRRTATKRPVHRPIEITPTPAPEPLAVRRQTAAAMLSIGVESLRLLVIAGEIVPVTLNGGEPRYSVEHLREWLRKRIAATTAANATTTANGAGQ